MPTHRIALRGPWNVAFTPAAADTTSLPTVRRITLPTDWVALFGSTAGMARFERTFHRPTNLEAGDQVELVLAGCGGRGRLWFNGELLAEWDDQATQHQFPVASRLIGFNRLEIELTFDPHQQTSPGGLYDVVMLEIVLAPGH